MEIESQTTSTTEIISVASGKGGTGKTIILASLGYALLTSGLRVLFVDTDLATDGLSLFLMGLRGWEAISTLTASNTFSGYLRTFSKSADLAVDQIAPFRINRGRQDDHGQIYEAIVSGRGLYGDVSDEINGVAMPSLARENFRVSVRDFFNTLRDAHRWDYVLVDTRGGSASILPMYASFRTVSFLSRKPILPLSTKTSS